MFVLFLHEIFYCFHFGRRAVPNGLWEKTLVRIRVKVHPLNTTVNPISKKRCKSYSGVNYGIVFKAISGDLTYMMIETLFYCTASLFIRCLALLACWCGRQWVLPSDHFSGPGATIPQGLRFDPAEEKGNRHPLNAG